MEEIETTERKKAISNKEKRMRNGNEVKRENKNKQQKQQKQQKSEKAT